MKKIIIQYSAINQKGILQHFLKEVSYAVYQYTYKRLSDNGLITNLEILPL